MFYNIFAHYASSPKFDFTLSVLKFCDFNNCVSPSLTSAHHIYVSADKAPIYLTAIEELQMPAEQQITILRQRRVNVENM